MSIIARAEYDNIFTDKEIQLNYEIVTLGNNLKIFYGKYTYIYVTINFFRLNSRLFPNSFNV